MRFSEMRWRAIGQLLRDAEVHLEHAIEEGEPAAAIEVYARVSYAIEAVDGAPGGVLTVPE